MHILDCTLRDGGYYNSWDFSLELVQKYLDAMALTGVSTVEVGFRGLGGRGYLGFAAFSSDSILDGLDIQRTLSVAVMVNASDLLADDDGGRRFIGKQFRVSADSKVDLVRIATHLGEYRKLRSAVTQLKELGYQIGLNLMQSTQHSDNALGDFCSFCDEVGADIVYFADSTGSYSRGQLLQHVEIIKGRVKCPIGFHLHNNCGLALSLALEAVDAGVAYVDSTLTGMGRGPGNVPTELLLPMVGLDQGQNLAIDHGPLLELVEDYFWPLQKEMRWGASYLYSLAGRWGIHPTYVQRMIADGRYSMNEMIDILNGLKSDGSIFSSDRLGEAFESELLKLKAVQLAHTDTCDESWLGKDVLVIGAGTSVETHQNALLAWIERRKPIVCSLNAIPKASVLSDKIMVLISSFPSRIMELISNPSLVGSATKVITPYVISGDGSGENGSFNQVDWQALPYKNSDSFDVQGDRLGIPSNIGLAYSLGVACKRGCSNIYLAGFDGFDAGDERNQEMHEVLSAFSEISDIKLFSVTPTMLPLAAMSVYEG